MNSATVRVPATTANLGPGYDCLGMALRIANRVTVFRGAGAENGAMAAEAGRAFFRRTKRKAHRFAWSVEGDVPRSRGLGSSVTVRLGILHGLNALAGSPLAGQELFELCAELEGHPDNAAPAAFGVFTIARAGAPVQRYRVGSALQVVLLIPDFEVETPAARRVLPKRISHRDAVVSASNAAAIAGAFASRKYEWLTGCFADGLHQPYREKLVPFLSQVIRAAERAGALGGWLSGSGSTIACAVLGDAAPVAEAMRKAAGLRGARTVITRADNTGTRVLA